METSVITLGNVKGIELSKTLIDKYHITDTVELVLEDEYIIIKPRKTPRNGWENSFKEMSENNEDSLLIQDVFEDENFDQ